MLGVATTSGVEGVAVRRVAEPLRRAALAALELTLAPEADRVHCSRSYQAGIAVHNVLPTPLACLSAPPGNAVASGSIYPNLDMWSPTPACIDLRRGYARNLWSFRRGPIAILSPLSF